MHCESYDKWHNFPHSNKNGLVYVAFQRLNALSIFEIKQENDSERRKMQFRLNQSSRVERNATQRNEMSCATRKMPNAFSMLKSKTFFFGSISVKPCSKFFIRCQNLQIVCQFYLIFAFFPVPQSRHSWTGWEMGIDTLNGLFRIRKRKAQSRAICFHSFWN